MTSLEKCVLYAGGGSTTVRAYGGNGVNDNPESQKKKHDYAEQFKVLQFNTWVPLKYIRALPNARAYSTIREYLKTHPEITRPNAKRKYGEVFLTRDNVNNFLKIEGPEHALSYSEVLDVLGKASPPVPESFVKEKIRTLGDKIIAQDGSEGYDPVRVEAIRLAYQELLKKRAQVEAPAQKFLEASEEEICDMEFHRFVLSQLTVKARRAYARRRKIPW